MLRPEKSIHANMEALRTRCLSLDQRTAQKKTDFSKETMLRSCTLDIVKKKKKRDGALHAPYVRAPTPKGRDGKAIDVIQGNV